MGDFELEVKKSGSFNVPKLFILFMTTVFIALMAGTMWFVVIHFLLNQLPAYILEVCEFKLKRSFWVYGVLMFSLGLLAQLIRFKLEALVALEKEQRMIKTRQDTLMSLALDSANQNRRQGNG